MLVKAGLPNLEALVVNPNSWGISLNDVDILNVSTMMPRCQSNNGCECLTLVPCSLQLVKTAPRLQELNVKGTGRDFISMLQAVLQEQRQNAGTCLLTKLSIECPAWDGHFEVSALRRLSSMAGARARAARSTSFQFVRHVIE